MALTSTRDLNGIAVAIDVYIFGEFPPVFLADSVGRVHGGFNTVDERDQVQVSHLVLQHASRHLHILRPIGPLSGKS